VIRDLVYGKVIQVEVMPAGDPGAPDRISITTSPFFFLPEFQPSLGSVRSKCVPFAILFKVDGSFREVAGIDK
jgi:hypothetical protein